MTLQSLQGAANAAGSHVQHGEFLTCLREFRAHGGVGGGWRCRRRRWLLDGRLLINHPTNFGDLTNDGWHKLPHDRVLGVGCDDPTTFHRISILEVTGKGKAIW